MSSPLPPLLFAGIAYLAMLFLVAYAAEREWLPARWVRHPLTYTLSLGVYATTWTFYGSVGFAANQGYLFLTIYIGVTAAFLLAPLLLQPLLRLVRDYQLTSLADLFAFRYASPWTGWLVTAFMLIGILPYIALQIQAVVTSAQVLTQEVPPGVLALGFCITVTLFAVLFGARQVTPREKHEGLVAAIAFESLIKLIALLACAAYAVYGIFGGPGELQAWLQLHPDQVSQLQTPLADGSAWTTMTLLAFSAAFLLPRQFHMIFAENINPEALRTASWAFPLFLLLLNLAIPIVLWAGRYLQLPGSPDFYALSLSLREPSGALTLLTFIGGISAASAMIIVESLALAAMCLNHLVLPLWVNAGAAPSHDLYGRLLWGRRILIALVIFTGYAAYISMRRSSGLVHLGLISFVAVTQFLPAVIAMLSWPRANRVGFLAGVSGGMTLWFLILVWPLLVGSPSPLSELPLHDRDPWLFATFWSLGCNLVLFIGGSLLAQPNTKEQAADQACRLNAVLMISEAPRVMETGELRERIAAALGAEAAQAELQRALADLKLDERERRPRQLHFLFERLQRNLSGLIGPQLAHEVLAASDSGQPGARRLVEEELEHSQDRLRGLAAELNHLRRFHRQVLQDLPIGVCSLGAQGEVLLWNERMAEIAGLSADQVLGMRVAELAAPWRELFAQLIAGDAIHLYKQQVPLRGSTRWLSLHKETIGTDAASAPLVLLVEDFTEQQQLEAELTHSARLASIGTLASGVAHEIGNPLTGISCIAQNLRDESDAQERRQGLDDILQQSKRISDIVQSLLSFARPSAPEAHQLERLALAPLVSEAARLVRLSQSGRDIHFDNRIDETLLIDGNRARLTQVFVNLLSNAADASPPQARVEIGASRGAGSVTVMVRDWGCGISEAMRSRIFEPFVTSKQPGQGTGLGLPLVFRIVADHGGSISVDSQLGLGTTFTLRLPAAPESLHTVVL